MVRGGKTYSLLGQLASLDRYALRLHRRLRLWESDMNVGKKKHKRKDYPRGYAAECQPRLI